MCLRPKRTKQTTEQEADRRRPSGGEPNRHEHKQAQGWFAQLRSSCAGLKEHYVVSAHESCSVITVGMWSDGFSGIRPKPGAVTPAPPPIHHTTRLLLHMSPRERVRQEKRERKRLIQIFIFRSSPKRSDVKELWRVRGIMKGNIITARGGKEANESSSRASTLPVLRPTCEPEGVTAPDLHLRNSFSGV
ncbi:unnamed protein product [Pleuronectes platessa]|uniref:Uncharacterized protein n=1 Tax=Pleuronectes platessa TaxID=8262 RepID=A0A9N7Z547_PLEPL|nr:unnamed protein product [Pleuronectes platessa]